MTAVATLQNGIDGFQHQPAFRFLFVMACQAVSFQDRNDLFAEIDRLGPLHICDRSRQVGGIGGGGDASAEKQEFSKHKESYHG